jgi:photosystem II PsbY protein
MDLRILIVFAPVLIAAGWALFNIGRAAIQQLRRLNSASN